MNIESIQRDLKLEVGYLSKISIRPNRCDSKKNQVQREIVGHENKIELMSRKQAEGTYQSLTS